RAFPTRRSSDLAVLGDLLGAFVKRRLNVEPGKAFPILDQLDFILGSVVLGYAFFQVVLISIRLVVVVTPPIHLATNYGAYRLGIKKTRWQRDRDRLGLILQRASESSLASCLG